MKLRNVTFSVLAAAGLAGIWTIGTSALIPPAAAQVSDAKQIVDQAKRDGVIGETIAGYLAVVGAQPGADVINAMNEINIKRKGLYTRLARTQNVKVEKVATLAGEKQITTAGAGEKVLDGSGNWRTIR